MQRIVFWILILLPSLTNAAELRVVATLSDLGSIARSIGGDRIDLDVIVDGRHDPHAVEILPSYMLKVSRADLFLQTGLDLELWAPQVVQGSRNRKLRVVNCAEGIEIRNVPLQVDASMGDVHVAGNPHYWLDPANGLVIARTITHAFVLRDPDGEATYEANYQRFAAALTAKLAEWKQKAAPLAGLQIVYFHDSWPYFNAAFGFEAAAFVEPKPGVSPSPGHTAMVVDLIRQRNIPLVVREPFAPEATCASIAKQGGAKLLVLATSVGGVDGADDYISLFDANLNRILDAVRREP